MKQSSIAHIASGQMLFKVVTPQDGREYRVYTNGKVDGFGEDAIVFNYYPALNREACLRSTEARHGYLTPQMFCSWWFILTHPRYWRSALCTRFATKPEGSR